MRAGQGYPDGMATPLVSVAPSTGEKPPRPRRWIPLSLRMFSAMMVLLFSGSLLSVWLPYHREQQMAHKIRSWGDSCYSCWSFGGPASLRRLVGDDYLMVFHRVYLVNLYGQTIDDSTLVQLGTLANLQYVCLGNTAVTDKGIAELQKKLPACEIRRAPP